MLAYFSILLTLFILALYIYFLLTYWSILSVFYNKLVVWFDNKMFLVNQRESTEKMWTNLVNHLAAGILCLIIFGLGNNLIFVF